MNDTAPLGEAMPLNILYLAHDLADASVHKRVQMLKEGGAAVTVAGFRRTNEQVSDVAGCPAVNFGKTYNADFLHRAGSVLREIILLRRYRSLFENADILLARNLEMFALAVRGKSICSAAPGIIYESLDIHRLLLGQGLLSRCLRALEGWLCTRSCGLITSSPAFIREYLGAISNVHLPVLLVENKVFYAQAPQIRAPIPRPPGPPWRIGWFGILRCKKSLNILTELVRRSEGAVEVVMRGKPALDQMPDFGMRVAQTPGMSFHGPYTSPDDLQSMYAPMHFTWAIDMFEEGLNSSWLLPNRLYEGGFYDAVPIAAAAVETGRFLKALGIGVVLDAPLPQTLADFFTSLTPSGYRALEQSVMQVPRSRWRCTTEECRSLVRSFRTLAGIGAHG